jgi:predicted metal-dependent enzyme (double-stranded beta helix superfamily)
VWACGHAHRQAAPNVAGGEAVPVYREPGHRLVFESPLVRVLDVRLSPGDTSAYHVHAAPMVGIVIQGARIWTQQPGATPGPVAAPEAVPSVFDNWSQALPYTHRVANVDTVPLHYVVAEWLAASGWETPALPDGPSRRLIKEGPTTRVYEITLSPGTATEAHTHAAPGLTVQATSGALSDDGTPRAKGGAGTGSWSWRGAQYRHVLRNDGSTPLIIYEIDWR